MWISDRLWVSFDAFFIIKTFDIFAKIIDEYLNLGRTFVNFEFLNLHLDFLVKNWTEIHKNWYCGMVWAQTRKSSVYSKSRLKWLNSYLKLIDI